MPAVLLLSLGCAQLPPGDTGGVSQAAREREIYATFRNHFLDEVDLEPVEGGTLMSRLQALDPHTRLLPTGPGPRATGAVGLRLASEREAVIITGVVRGSPAANAGLGAGARLISIDGQSVGPGALAEAVNLLRGAEGTRVRLLVRTDGEIQTHIMLRESITVPPLSVEVMPGGVGYLAIPAFGENTAQEFSRVAGHIRDEGALAGLVLDLRDNSGGLLPAAVSVADAFLSGGLVVSLHGRRGTAPVEHRAGPLAPLGSLPLLVLVNRRTGSAAEILAAALQDRGRARIAGEPTLGKGTVQAVVPLKYGGALKVTTHRYRTPDGRNLESAGVLPDHLLPPVRNAVDGESAEQDWPRLAAGLLREDSRSAP